MKQTFQVENVKCNGCATTLKNKLLAHFGPVDVNLEVEPREITLEIEEEKVDDLQTVLRTLGYPLSTDKLGMVDHTTAKFKSFVSCAVGKIDNHT